MKPQSIPCTKCNQITKHQPKLDAVKTGHMVCKKCSKMNPIPTATDTPDRWMLIALPDNGYKVFASWAGGYLSGDSWKLNSGIKQVIQDETHYYIVGYSGSIYKCRKESYGTATSYTEGVLHNIISKSAGLASIVKLDDLKDLELFQENLD